MGLRTISQAWNIDAWSVLDGIAFTSLRPPRSWTKPHLPIPETTVLLAPPDWRAVSISRLSTALAASRGAFQEGVLDENDIELAFPSLEAVRRVVRRAYLAGGLGLDDPGAAEPVGTPPEPSPAPGGASVWAKVWHDVLNVGTVQERSLVAKRLVRVFLDHESARDGLLRCVGDLVSATGPWQSRKAAERRDWDDFVCWLQLAHNLTGTATHASPHLDDHYRRYGYWPGWVGGMPLSRRFGLLFRLPAVAADHPSFPPPRTLGDQLLLTLASRTYFESRQTFDKFLPIVAASLVLVGATNPIQLPGAQIDIARVAGPALDWLMECVLDKHEAGIEDAIEHMTEKLVIDIAWLKLAPKDRLTEPGRGTQTRPNLRGGDVVQRPHERERSRGGWDTERSSKMQS